MKIRIISKNRVHYYKYTNKINKKINIYKPLLKFYFLLLFNLVCLECFSMKLVLTLAALSLALFCAVDYIAARDAANNPGQLWALAQLFGFSFLSVWSVSRCN